MKHPTALVFFALFALVALFSGCDTAIEPKGLAPGYYQSPPQPISQVFVPVTIEVDKLEERVNQSLPQGVIAEGDGRDGDTRYYHYSVSLTGRTRVQVLDNALRLTLPIHAKARGTQLMCAGIWHHGKCKGIPAQEDATTSANVTGIVDLPLSLSSDYQLHIDPAVRLTLNNRVYLNMDLFGRLIKIDIDITQKVQQALDRESPKIAAKLKAQLNDAIEQIDLKGQVETLWQQAAAGLPAGDTWVQFRPNRVLFQGLKPQNNGTLAQFGIGFEGPIQVSLHRPDAHLVPLPELTQVQSMNASFNAHVPFYGAFEDLQQRLNQELAGQTLNQDQFTLTHSTLSLSGIALEGQPALLIGVAFRAEREAQWWDLFTRKANGTLFFTATPELDYQNQTIRVQDLAMTAETSSLLFDAGLDWLLTLKKEQLAQRLVLDLSPEIERLLNKSNGQLSQGVMVGNAQLFGTINTMQLEGFYLDDQALIAYAQADGQLTLQLDVE